jgi:hypothetical protein
MTRPAPFPRIELDVGDALLAREPLLRVAGVEVPHLRDVRMAKERVVVDGELGVERLHLASGRDDQRVDLAEHRVGPDEGVIEAAHEADHLLLLVWIADACCEAEPAGLERLEPDERIDVQSR